MLLAVGRSSFIPDSDLKTACRCRRSGPVADWSHGMVSQRCQLEWFTSKGVRVRASKTWRQGVAASGPQFCNCTGSDLETEYRCRRTVIMQLNELSPETECRYRRTAGDVHTTPITTQPHPESSTRFYRKTSPGSSLSVNSEPQFSLNVFHILPPSQSSVLSTACAHAALTQSWRRPASCSERA